MLAVAAATWYTNRAIGDVMNKISLDKIIKFGLALTEHYGARSLSINGRSALTNPWCKNNGEPSYIFVSVDLGKIRCGPSISRGFTMSENMVDKIINKEM